MGYKKVYYDDIWAVDSEASSLCNKWNEQIAELYQKINSLSETDSIKGAGAESIKNYLYETHSVLIAALTKLCQTYMAQLISYYYGYTSQVDTGDGSKYGVRYTTIVCDEISDGGKIPPSLKRLIERTDEVRIMANNAAQSVISLVTLPSPKTSELINSLSNAINKSVGLNSKVENYEGVHAKDFSDIDTLISELTSIVNNQLSENRTPSTSYRSGAIGTMCNYSDLVNSINKCDEILTDFQNSPSYKDAVALAFNRDAIIHEEEKESREWIQWVAIGAAVIGSVVLIVVTAGGATPLVCAGVGAAVGVTTAVANSFAENYIENGSLVEGMDWSDFTKDCLIGAVTGAITGYAGATSFVNSATKPIEKVLLNTSVSLAKSGAESLIETTWDVGEALIAGKSGEEILSVLEEDVGDMMKNLVKDGFSGAVRGFAESNKIGSALQQPIDKAIKGTALTLVDTGGNALIDMTFDVGDALVKGESLENIMSVLDADVSDMMGTMLAKGAGAFAEGLVGGKFDVSSDKKGVLRKIGEETLENLSGTLAEGTVTTGWKVGECFISGESSEKCISVLSENASDFLKDFAQQEAKTVISTISKDVVDKKWISKIDNKSAETVFKTANETFADTLSKATDSIIDQEIDHIFAGDEDHSIDFGKVWNEGLDGGKTIAKDFGKNLGSNLKDNILEKERKVEINGTERTTNGMNQKIINDLSAKDYDHDGQVEIVTFGEGEVEGVLKEDYDAAMELAGKGAYKDKTVQDILGLAHDVDVSPDKVDVHKVKIDEVQKAKLKARTNAKTYSVSYEEATNTNNN